MKSVYYYLKRLKSVMFTQPLLKNIAYIAYIWL